MRSIRLKLWFAIVGITLLMSMVIWVVQATLLKKTYMSKKQDEILKHTQQVSDVIQEKGTIFSAVEIETLAHQYNYSIEVYIEGELFMTAQPLGSGNLLNGRWALKSSILKSLSESDPQGPFVATMYPSSFSGTNYYISAMPGNLGEKKTIIILASTLAPVSEALEVIKYQQIVTTIVLLGLASLLAWWIAHSISKPVKILQMATMEIAKGNLGTMVLVKGKDELADLSENFNKMSEKISQAHQVQRELVANVSHDIRTPLTMIKGYAETIIDLTGDDKEVRNNQLQVIIAETDRLNFLLSDMLSLSQLQAGKLQLTRNKLSLWNLLQDVMKRYQLLIEQEQFCFTLNCPKDAMIVADAQKIQQVLYNLINNATNHTGADKKIWIQVTAQPEGLQLQIRDTGPGINPDDLPFIWDRYYKPYRKQDRTGMGTGLGLSIVKEILQAHHFMFGVNSTLGQGTTFWVLFPCSDA